MKASPFELIRQDLQAVERRMRAIPFPAADSILSTLESLLDAGGKRIRPTLSLLFGRMFAAPEEPLFSYAAAVEMVHTATLVHDDLIDNSHLRRGRPTPNDRWSPGATVLFGDFLFAWAAQLAAATGSTPVMQRFSSALTAVVNGEIGQMLGRPIEHSLAEYRRRIQAKTASLFEAACEGPALLAGQSATVETAADYGRNLGMAYQITDDILDYIGDSDRAGKPVGCDLRQGLITLPALMYAESHPQDADMQALLAGERERTDVDRLILSIRNSDAIGQSRTCAREYIDQTMDTLASLPAGAHRDALGELAELVVEREK